jgi:hypothetical protein
MLPDFKVFVSTDTGLESPAPSRLIINLKTAKTLGIEISPMLSRADEVFE